MVAFVFDFINGFHDSANSIATVVGTRVLTPLVAVAWAATFNFLAAFTVGTAVAKTVGKGMIDVNIVTPNVILAGILGAIIWDLITWYYGLPSSSSHAIIGGIMGAVIAHDGLGTLHWGGLKKIILSLIISPILGTVLGFVFMVALLWMVKDKSPHILNKGFRKLQILSAAFMAFSHGTADAQKSMGVITMALVSYGMLPTFVVPVWVKVACAVAMGLGTAAG